MAAMSYTRTVFVDVPEDEEPPPGAPDLDAGEINKIGLGIEDAHEAIAEHETRLDTIQLDTDAVGVHETRLDTIEPTVADHGARLGTIEPTVADLNLGLTTPVTVPYATSVVLDATEGSVFECIATGDLTADISGGVAGKTQTIVFKVNASGAERALTFTGLADPITIPADEWWIGVLRSTSDSGDLWLLSDSAGGGGATSGGGADSATVTAHEARLDAIEPTVAGLNLGVASLLVVPYAASILLDPTQAATFQCVATGDLTVDVSAGATNQAITLRVKASGAQRTLHLTGIAVPIDITAGKWWVGTLQFIQGDGDWVLTDGAGELAGGQVARVAEGPLSLLDPRVGAALDGTGDQSTAVATAISLLPSTGGHIYQPPGVLRASVLADRPVRWEGAGDQASIIRAPAGFTGAVFTTASEFCHVQNMQLDGNSTATSVLKLTRPRLRLENLHVLGADGDGIWFEGTGTGTAAHAAQVSNVRVMSCTNRGIFVNAYGYDQEFTNVWIGSCGVALRTQNTNGRYVNLHAWGSTGNNIEVRGGANEFCNCYVETGSGNGYDIFNADRNLILGGTIWKNQGVGVNIQGASHRTRVQGVLIYDQGGNGITGVDAQLCQIIGNQFYDDTTSSQTQDRPIVTSGAADYWVVSGNIYRDADHAAGGNTLVGSNNAIVGNVPSTGATVIGGGIPDDGSVNNAKVATNAAIDLVKTVDSAASAGRLAMTSAERTKLTGVAAGATANSSDATLLARANHTGTQAVGTITGLAAIATSGSAADLSAGTVPTARLASGTANSGTFLRGDSTWAPASGATVPKNVVAGTTYTPVLSDAGKIIETSSSSPVTLLIPTNASVGYATDTVLEVCQYGAGQITFGSTGGTSFSEPFTTSLALTWSTVAGGAISVTGGTQGTLSGGSAQVRAEHDVGSSDMYSQITWTAGGTSADATCGVCTRLSSSANTGYLLELDDFTNFWTFSKVVAGSYTQLGSGSISPTKPVVIRLESQGTSHRCYVGGSLVTTITDASITTGQRGGIISYNPAAAGVVFDDFSTGALTSGVAIRTPSSLTTRARYSTAALRYRGSDEWVLSGDLT